MGLKMKIYHWKTLYDLAVCHVDNTHANSVLYDANHHAIQLTTDRVMTRDELASTVEWRELITELQPHTLLTQVKGNIMEITEVSPSAIDRVISLFQKTGIDVKALREAQTLLSNNQGDLAALTTTQKSSIVSAINEIKSQFNSIDLTAIIDDSVQASGKTWSSQKIVAEINGKFDEIINGAPGTLDTLKEIADVLQNNPDILSSVQSALNKAVRVDIEQTFTEAEQVQGRKNIGAASEANVDQLAANVGDIAALNDTVYTDARDGIGA